ncbi:hypothetical protein A2765_05635 [Candidatus Kaiserbacteria bacterium RIFCSPHIGHO2_01_FULL_56_24]|uniref:PEGA domain-containing protein n=1 Tax=Candidatus Kaiserbacteria bacterium RIFCSPHIGHO2_01_FULL_56_24 TaxID=1798487 RepID=A0A1F6DAM4_9BACT|nr:MAG: hypothetical protein A2765_05635 [Candidatus Kaiserbacteria bacterium RIFCSPHIGHO2_01_FULL_56_24]
MQPFPAQRRRLYFMLFLLLFAILLPAVILYADGWRYKPGFGLVRTGGVYIDVPYPDAAISINGVQSGHSGFLQRGFLQRGFYIGNLAPSAYVVRVDRTGYRSWGRILVVEPQLVTDARVLLIPDEIDLTRLAVTGTASSTKLVSRPTYDSYIAAFATSTAASSTVPVDQSDGIGLFLEKGDVVARWLRTNPPPSVFCSSPSYCGLDVSVKREGGPALFAQFFKGGVIYRTKEGGIYFGEIDVRSTPAGALLYAAPGADFRVIDEAIIVKSGSALYEVEGL